ncbi:MAG TPA: NUDIX domain-containing protein [Ruania sp.]|nr:NUDIX domain-containing protein [Ruania sp.]
MTSRFQVVPAAYVLCLRRHQDRTEVLLQLRQNTGYRDGHWACAAAGHIEESEPADLAAVREAGEELGIRIDPADLAPLTAMHRTHANGRPIDERADFFFTCRTWQGTPQLMEPEKAAALDWFALADLPQPLVPHEEQVLRLLHRDEVPAFLTFGFD